MLIMIGGKTLGWCPSACDSDEPCSTDSRTEANTSPRCLFSVCSDRIDSARNSDRPELIIVANCRDAIARSFNLTLLPVPGILISLFSPALA